MHAKETIDNLSFFSKKLEQILQLKTKKIKPPLTWSKIPKYSRLSRETIQ